MDEPDSVMDLMEKYTSALVLACYETLVSEFQWAEPKLKHEKRELMEEILEQIFT